MIPSHCLQPKHFIQCLSSKTCYLLIGCSQKIQPMPGSKILSHFNISSHWLQPRHLKQCLPDKSANAWFQYSLQKNNLLSSHCPHPEISTNAYSNILVIAASLAVFSLALAKTIQPMPDYNILYSISSPYRCSQNTNTTRVGDEFESLSTTNIFPPRALFFKWTNSLTFFMRNTCKPVCQVSTVVEPPIDNAFV